MTSSLGKFLGVSLLLLGFFVLVLPLIQIITTPAAEVATEVIHQQLEAIERSIPAQHIVNSGYLEDELDLMDEVEAADDFQSLSAALLAYCAGMQSLSILANCDFISQYAEKITEMYDSGLCSRVEAKRVLDIIRGCCPDL